MQLSTFSRNDHVDGQNTVSEGGKNMPFHPRAQNCPLRGIASLHEKNPEFHL